jgi:hypothetical protein
MLGENRRSGRTREQVWLLHVQYIPPAGTGKLCTKWVRFRVKHSLPSSDSYCWVRVGAGITDNSSPPAEPTHLRIFAFGTTVPTAFSHALPSFAVPGHSRLHLPAPATDWQPHIAAAKRHVDHGPSQYSIFRRSALGPRRLEPDHEPSQVRKINTKSLTKRKKTSADLGWNI